MCAWGGGGGGGGVEEEVRTVTDRMQWDCCSRGSYPWRTLNQEEKQRWREEGDVTWTHSPVAHPLWDEEQQQPDVLAVRPHNQGRDQEQRGQGQGLPCKRGTG